jgi:hypothetical protein
MPLRYIEKACSLVDTDSVQNASHSDDPGQHFYSPSFIDKHIERIHYDLIFHALPFPCPPDTSPRESYSSIIELSSTSGQHLLAVRRASFQGDHQTLQSGLSLSSMGVGMLSTPIINSTGFLIMGIPPQGTSPWGNSSFI